MNTPRAVSESHQLELERARERSGLPLLCLPTPAGAGELRVAPETRALGLALDPSGVLAIHGPIPAGPSELAFSYRVPVVALPLDFSRRFGTEVELLEVVIADMGLVPRTSRLHRRRPIRSEDRNYLALEAFSVGADETVTLQLARIANASGAGRSLAAVLVALGGMAALGFLLAPLRGAGEAGASAERSEAELAREAVYRAIDDLDEDLATGKLSPDDHRRMREELRAEAVALLRREREGSRATAPPESPRCPHCDADVRRGDRFCSQCGQTLAPQSGGAESAA